MERCEGRMGFANTLPDPRALASCPVQGRKDSDKETGEGSTCEGPKGTSAHLSRSWRCSQGSWQTTGKESSEERPKGIRGYPPEKPWSVVACQYWQMVLHPDEKVGKYACLRSSSIAVKLSASAIHTFASLSVYVCVCFPYLLSCWKKKKNQPGHECTHKSHVRTRVSLIQRCHRTLLPLPPLHPQEPGGPCIQHSKESRNGHLELQFPWNGASRDMGAF